MILLNGNKLSHRLVQDLTARTTRERGVNRQSRNDDWNVSWVFRGSLLRRTWLGISFKVQRMVQRLIGILELGLSSVNLKGDLSLSLIRKSRATHLGGNLCLGAEAQLVDHAVQMS